MQGVPLSEHVRRLRDSREVFLREVEGLTPAQWRTPLPDQEDDGCEFSPEWILFHLARHEMEHNEQISWLKSRWASHRRTGNRT